MRKTENYIKTKKIKAIVMVRMGGYDVKSNARGLENN